VEEPLSGAVRPGSAVRVISAMSMTWTAKPPTLSMRPIEIAPTAATPNLWKKRTSRASLAAVAGNATAMNDGGVIKPAALRTRRHTAVCDPVA